MSLQPNPSFKDNFDDRFVEMRLEWLWSVRRKRVKKGRKERRRERGKESKRKGNSKGLTVGRKEREREKERRKYKTWKRGYLMSTLIYLHAKIKLVPSFPEPILPASFWGKKKQLFTFPGKNLPLFHIATLKIFAGLVFLNSYSMRSISKSIFILLFFLSLPNDRGFQHPTGLFLSRYR